MLLEPTPAPPQPLPPPAPPQSARTTRRRGDKRCISYRRRKPIVQPGERVQVGRGGWGARGYRKQLTRQQNNNASSLPIIKARRISSLSTEQAECEILLAPLFMLFNCRGRSDQEIFFFYTRAGKSYIERKHRRRIQGGRKRGKRRGPFGVGGSWLRRGYGPGGPRFPARNLLRQELFVYQSIRLQAEEHFSVLRGLCEAFGGKPSLYQTAANPPTAPSL